MEKLAKQQKLVVHICNLWTLYENPPNVTLIGSYYLNLILFHGKKTHSLGAMLVSFHSILKVIQNNCKTSLVFLYSLPSVWADKRSRYGMRKKDQNTDVARCQRSYSLGIVNLWKRGRQSGPQAGSLIKKVGLRQAQRQPVQRNVRRA